jgi:hypothetical protein
MQYSPVIYISKKEKNNTHPTTAINYYMARDIRITDRY